jgi:hypothetical protein
MATRAHTVPRFFLGGFTALADAATREPFVWLGSLSTGQIERRSPKNVAIARGYYDGMGAFGNAGISIEAHLARIESEAAFAIRKFTASPIGKNIAPDPAIWRFLAWQAARTPGWFKQVEEWMNEREPGAGVATVEPPPEGFENIKDRQRSQWVEDPNTGKRLEVATIEELNAYRMEGWRWVLSTQDRLECLHMQAWYFQVRHFRRLSWTRLDTPAGDWFITSDRAVTWLADGTADTPPAALRHPTSQVVATLTRKSALVGRHVTAPIAVTPREVNRFVACTACEWIAGPTKDVVEQALRDRSAVIER